MRPHILIVDDEPASLLALSEALRHRLPQVVVDTATTAAPALTLIADTDYDVIICDVIMPGMDGIALLKEAQRRRPETVVVMVTAGGSEREHQALYHGAYAFIEKPLEIDRLTSVIGLALQRANLLRRVTQENRKSLEESDTTDVDYLLGD